jgi:hypothetical protein
LRPRGDRVPGRVTDRVAVVNPSSILLVSTPVDGEQARAFNAVASRWPELAQRDPTARDRAAAFMEQAQEGEIS